MVRKEVQEERSRNKENTKIPISGSKEKAYRLVAPIQRPGLTEELTRQMADTKIEVRLGDMWALSNQLSKNLRDMITKQRVPLKPVLTGGVFSQQGSYPYMEDNFVQIKLEHDALSIGDLPPVEAFYVATDEDPGLENGAIVVPDPYLQYLSTLKEGEAPKQVYSAMDSAALRAVFPTVNGKLRIESILDGGSQIVSMALSIAEELGLSWDPDIQIFMQSANGQLKKSAGLARNTSFEFGDLTVYLQVHIIDQPAYHVLLGRPFDILTESLIQNRRDGSQTLTIQDPNSEKRQTIPTLARGVYSTKTPVKRKVTVEEVQDEGDQAKR